jgi:hypothetical protein
LAEDISAPVATCPIPTCGKPIPYDHSYACCAECGQDLPAEIQARLPRLQERKARVATARAERQGSPEPYYWTHEAEAITRLYRRLILLVGGEFLLNFVVLALLGKDFSAGMLSFLVMFAVSVFIAITAYDLSKWLDTGSPLFWALALFLPCLNVLSLLFLSLSATSWCRRHGFKVGFLGPTGESVKATRR